MVYKNTLFDLNDSDIYVGWGYILYLTNIINLKVKHILNISHIKDDYIINTMGDYSTIDNIIQKKKYLFYKRICIFEQS